MKDTICVGIGCTGSMIAAAFGGWSAALSTLLIFMATDYITGLIVAGVFHKSEKTENGTLESRVGWKGLCRKGMSLLIVLLAYRVDLMSGGGVLYFRDAACIGFIANEFISIVENAGLMGVPLPAIVNRIIDVLKKKEDENNE